MNQKAELSPRQKIPLTEKPTPGSAVVGLATSTTNLRCPHCGRNGTFSGYPQSNDIQWQQLINRETNGVTVAKAGLRCCPNVDCGGLVFVVLDVASPYPDHLVSTYPAELKEFDPTGLPDTIRECIVEAIKCRSQGCYRASALMVRKTLEELCQDRKATGSNLFERIENLQKQIVIAQDLVEGAHELRFLGNDAAHVEARVYQSVGREETDVAIDLVKELLRATYQTASLVARIRSFKSRTEN